MATARKKKSGLQEDPTNVSFYKSTNRNAGRDMESTLRNFQKTANKSGAQRIGSPTWNFAVEYGKYGQTGGRVTVSQPALIPVKGKKNTVTYGTVSATKLTTKLGRDVSKSSVKAAKGQGGGERMNPKKAESKKSPTKRSMPKTKRR